MSDIKSAIEEKMLLWLPDNNEVNPEDLHAIYCCHCALDKLLQGEISIIDYCDILDAYGVNMDGYIDTVANNLENINTV